MEIQFYYMFLSFEQDLRIESSLQITQSQNKVA
jgi:hypothetical protein